MDRPPGIQQMGIDRGWQRPFGLIVRIRPPARLQASNFLGTGTSFEERAGGWESGESNPPALYMGKR